jgi:hypothetical protein
MLDNSPLGMSEHLNHTTSEPTITIPNNLVVVERTTFLLLGARKIGVEHVSSSQRVLL